MRDRILKGWTITRWLYFLIGVYVIYQSVADRQWFGVFFGGYFASMGLFAIGCASGNCSTRNVSNVPEHFSTDELQDVEFVEIKSK